MDQCKLHIETAQKEGKPLLCNQQRSALMKSLLNFLKRTVGDANLAVQVRRIMEMDLPDSLIHVAQFPQYYGSSLLHCALMVVTQFIYQEVDL